MFHCCLSLIIIIRPSITQMDLRIIRHHRHHHNYLICPQINPQSIRLKTLNPFMTPNLSFKPNHHQISCTNNNNSSSDDFDLASDLAMEVEKMNAQMVQRAEAMEKSREILFKELCKYLDLKPEGLKKKWERLEEQDKLGLVNGFVSDWGVNFHPLSARSVKEMVEDYMVGEDNKATSSDLFPGLKKMIGL